MKTIACDICRKKQATLGGYVPGWWVCYQCFEKADASARKENRWIEERDFLSLYPYAETPPALERCRNSNMSAKKSKAKSIRPPGRNPVLAFRVRRPLMEMIKTAALEGGRTISEEVQWRLELSFYHRENYSQYEQNQFSRWAS